jgi:hypothetical protein
LVTPARTPGVLDLVVVSTVEGSVTNSQDTVVKVGSAGTSEHTGLVELEGSLVSLDGNRDGLLVKGRHQSSIGVGGNISVGDRSDLSILGAGSLVAGASLLGGSRDIRIVSLVADTTVLLDPVEGIVHPSTVATHVGSTVAEVVAVNKVLLREGLQHTILVLVSTLKSTSGGERPARTALALVLDRSDGTGRNPINLGSKGGRISRSLVNLLRLAKLRTRKSKLDESSPLIKRHVGELVVAKGIGVVARVVGLDDIIVVSEVLKHLDEVSTRFRSHFVFLLPVNKLLDIVVTRLEVSSGNSGQLKNKMIKINI